MNLGTKLLLNWLAMGIGMLSSIALYRLQLHTLGAAALGTWMAVSSTYAYLALLEMGLGAAVNRYSATNSALGKREQEEELLSTALCLYLCMAAVATVLGVVGSHFVGRVLHVPAALRAQTEQATLLISFSIGATFAFSVFRGLIYGWGRSDVIALVSIGRHLAYATLVVVLLRRGAGIRALAAAGLLADGAAGLCLMVAARRLRETRVRLRRPNLQLAQELFHFCSTVILSYTGQHFLRNSTLPLLQRALGPEVVAGYAAAERLATIFFMLVTQMATVLTPTLAAACAVSRGAVEQPLCQIGRVGMALGLPPLMVLLALGDFLLMVWLGPTMARNALFLRLLGLAMLAQLLSFGTDVCAYAVGGNSLYGLIKLGSGLCAIGLISTGIRVGQAAGAALFCALSVVLCDAVLTPLAICRRMGVPPWRYYRALFTRLPGTVVLLSGLVLGLRLCHPARLLPTITLAALGTALGWTATYLYYLRDEDRALLRDRVASRKSERAHRS